MLTRALIWLRRLLIVGAVGVIAFIALAPETSTYSSNIDDAPMVTRTLVPRETITTTPLVVEPDRADDLLIVDGDRVIRLPRTSQVLMYLYVASELYR